ncbi:MAG TPA: NRDE family protein, partial [Burkholderiaceae bacterium]|nr:NRDE family protein [Burkholderiaceae bacterium]
MCLAYIAYRTHPDWPLFIAANRDEFHARPTQAAAPWESNSDIIAGIDLQAKGTWLGVSTQGRFALLTNYRDLSEPETGSRSRGFLVSDFLRGEQTPAAYMQEVAE